MANTQSSFPGHCEANAVSRSNLKKCGIAAITVGLFLVLWLLGPRAAHAPPPPIAALAPVETLLDGRQELVGVAVAEDGTIYVADRAAGLVYRLVPPNPPTVAVSGLDRPAGLALDDPGRLLIAEEQAGRLLRLEPSGALTVLATGLKSPRWLAVAADGALYVSAHRLQGPDGPDPTEGREVLRLAPDGTLTVVATGIRRVEGLARLNGHLVVASKGLASGAESTGTLLRYPLLPDGSLGTPQARVDTGLKQPVGLLPDPLGALYVSSKELSTELDTAKRAVGKVHPDAHLTAFAQLLDDPQGVALAPDGSLLAADGKAGRLLRFIAPAPPILNPAPPAITNQAPLTLQGTTEPGALLTLLGGAAPVTDIADPTGHFSLPLPLARNASNRLELYATAAGGDGLTSAPTSVAVVHDDMLPIMALTSPTPGTLVRGIIVVTATASDASGSGLGVVTLAVDGRTVEATNAPPFTTSLDTATLSDGPHTLSATGRDRAGNEASASVGITTDNTPPTVAIPAPLDGGTVPMRTPELRVSYSDATTGVNPSTFRATLDGSDISAAFAVSPPGATATVPTPLANGPHTLVARIADQAGNVKSASALFTVSTGPDFALTAAPTTGTAIQGTGTTFNVTVIPFNHYANLVNLATSGLPGGATATLTPPQVAPNASALLAVTVPGSLAPGTYPFTATGTGLVNGTLTSRSVTASLTVLPAGPTAFSGRVVTTDEAPLVNVMIRLGSLTTQTDGSGNFLLSNPPPGPQVVLIDGATASTPTVSYPTIPVTVTIAPGQVTPLGFTPHLHAQPVGRTVPITPGQAATITDPAIPGFVVQIPAGVTIIGWDGQPNTQIGMRVVPPDRSPLPPLELPPGYTAGSLTMFYFGKVGGGTPTAPVPIIGPNELGSLPGEKVDLYFYDEAPDGSRPNQWAKYGTGTISPDGTQILPDTDPTGKPYGMPRFCCGGWRAVVPPPPPPANPNLAAPATSPGGTKGGEPVDLATGLFTLDRTDLVLPGRLPLVLARSYRSGDTQPGPFGIGGRHAYDAFLVFPTPSATEQLILVMPDLTRYAFARQADGSFRNATDPAMQGAVATLSGSTRVLTFKDQTVWTFDGNGRLIAQRDRHGHQVTITRDGQGRVTTLTEPVGRQITLSYSGTGLQITQVGDPLGRTVRYSYDGAGRLATVTDPAGGVTSYTYDTSHRLLTIIDPLGITFLRNEYDSAGRVSRQVQADGGVWNFAYTLTSGLVTETRLTDPRGHTTVYRFNTRGYLLSQTDALGQTTSFERAVGTNLLLSTTDPLGRVARFAYDGNGNVATITDPEGHARTFAYEPTFSRLTSTTDPLGNTTRFGYDGAGNLTTITDPLGAVTQFAYNGVGQPTRVTDPLGNAISFTYDPVSNLSTITDPLGNASTRTYDLVSRLLMQTDPRGKVTTLAYDALNRLTQIMDPLGQVTRFTYDGNGNLLTVTDALTHTITHEYDAMDRLSRRMDALGAVETLAYDSTGNLVNTSDRKGQTTTFTYDALNRRMRATYADGSIATFAYDAAGRLVLSDDTTDPHRPITLAYDPLDRLVAETTDMGTVAYEYDILGRRTQMTVNDLNPVTYTHDSASRLRNITQAPLNPVTIDYDAVGRRTKLTLPNAVSTEYQYDAASRVTALIYRNATGLLGDLTYTYDAAGNRTGVGGTFARTLLPDPVTAATYDPANRQLTFGDKTLNYDANGNLTSVTDSSGTTTFTWDVRNRLASLGGPGAVASFAYDGFGRRAVKVVNGLRSEFQYDVANVSTEIRVGSPVQYLRGLSLDELFSTTDGSGTHYATADTLGSILNLTNDQGTIQADYRYGPFGQAQASGTDGDNPFQFTGRENDGIGLYYYRLRYYHSALNRFISEDPLRPLTGSDLNLYTYVSNSPLNAVDPFGLYEEDVHRDLTFCLARRAGYSDTAARRTAAADQGTDDNPATSPYAGREARRDWHFTTEARRTELWKRALDGNLDVLGQYLHALQDSYSHEGTGPLIGHLDFGHAPDRTYNNPEKANRMARDTYNRLRQYLEVTTGQSVPDHWDQLRGQVDQFNRARTAHEKRKILCR